MKLSVLLKLLKLKIKSCYIIAFGDPSLNGKPSQKFKVMLQAVMQTRKPKAQYNYGNLFKNYPKDKAKEEIKQILESEGPKGLAAKGYNVGEIMKLIKS